MSSCLVPVILLPGVVGRTRKVSAAGISSQCCWQAMGTQISASRPTYVMPGKAKKRGHNGCRYQWQINRRSINHFPSPKHSDQAHSKHGRMLPAWPMFSPRALELAGSKLHSSPLRQEWLRNSWSQAALFPYSQLDTHSQNRACR